MSPKKQPETPKKFEQVEVTPEDEEEITRLFEMLTLEDVHEKLAGTDFGSLQGYMSAVEKKLKNYLSAYQQVKDTMATREKERKAEERKRKSAEDRATKKETEATRRMQPITLNIRYGLSGLMFSLTVPITTTLGELRRLIIAHFNTLNPMSKIPKGKAKDLCIFMNGKPLHLVPRKTLVHLNVVNNMVLVAMMSSDVPASSQTVDEEAASSVNAENVSEDEDEDEEEDEDE
ncbi:unnamed protein product [Effrenium voratum]|nr:unnamed protein product [Effrenium voratum]